VAKKWREMWHMWRCLGHASGEFFTHHLISVTNNLSVKTLLKIIQNSTTFYVTVKLPKAIQWHRIYSTFAIAAPFCDNET
jgi:hypothetical protein